MFMPNAELRKMIYEIEKQTFEDEKEDNKTCSLSDLKQTKGYQ